MALIIDRIMALMVLYKAVRFFVFKPYLQSVIQTFVKAAVWFPYPQNDPLLVCACLACENISMYV